MNIDYDALVHRQATMIVVRSLCEEYAGKVSDRDLTAGVETIHAALVELPITADGCVCEALAADDVCDACLREALGLNIGK